MDDSRDGTSDKAAPVQLAELRELVERLRHEVRARDEFISIAAHELRNPMTPILMRAEMLLASAQRGDSVDRLLPGLERLTQLIGHYMRRATALLDVSRITSGNLRLEPIPTDLSALLRRITLDFAPAAEQAGSRLVTDIEDGVTGIWDQLAIEQIVDNLLSNAIKFGAGRPIDIILATEPGGARIAVRDRGGGISAEDRGRVFERFEQVVATRSQGGFGIGLWIVGRLVAAMGGSVEIDSELGEGSTFRVLLPLATPAEGPVKA